MSQDCKAAYKLPPSDCGCHVSGGGMAPIKRLPCSCEHSDEAEGAGILSRARQLSRARSVRDVGRVVTKAAHETAGIATALVGHKSLTNSAQDTLRRFGNQAIVRLRVTRTPLSATLMQTLATLQQDVPARLRDKPYDQLFHLRLDLQLEGGKWVSTEKDGLVRVSATAPLARDSQTLEAEPAHAVTLRQLIDAARRRMGDGSFFSYDAYKNNCQRYVDTVLTASNLNSPELHAFVVQDLRGVLNATTRSTIRAVTDLNGVLTTVADRALL